MAKQSNWSDSYWLLLMQLYLRKPVGIKPVYSRGMVELALELHVHPKVLFTRMCSIASLETPGLERLWQTYSTSPRRLTKAVAQLRAMNGFNTSGGFYEGVAVAETFETDFRPVEGCGGLTPMGLVIVLDLYFRLTPVTMVADTPELAELARLMGTTAQQIVDVMGCFRRFDPYLRRTTSVSPAAASCVQAESPLYAACRTVWARYGNVSLNALASFATELKEYFR